MIVTRGDTYIKKFKYLDKNKQPIVLTSTGKIVFTVRDKIDGTILFTRTITASNYNQSTGTYTFTILPEHTNSVKLNENEQVIYKYDYQRTDTIDGLEMVKTIDKGDFVITYDITR